MGQLLSCVKPVNTGDTKHEGTERTSGSPRLRRNSNKNNISRNGKDIRTDSPSGENGRERRKVNFVEAGRRESVGENRPMDRLTKRTASTITATTGAAMQERIDHGLFEVDIALDHLIREADKRDAFVNDISLHDTFELSDDDEDMASNGSHSPPVSSVEGATIGEPKHQRNNQLKLRCNTAHLISVQEGIKMFDASLESDELLNEQDEEDKSELGHECERRDEAGRK